VTFVVGSDMQRSGSTPRPSTMIGEYACRRSARELSVKIGCVAGRPIRMRVVPSGCALEEASSFACNATAGLEGAHYCA
jgi:hypothetical protein